MIHELKIWPHFFKDVLSGRKRFEVRVCDRPFHVGDMLALNEFDSERGYTGRSCLVGVDYILADPTFVRDDCVILGFRPCEVLWEDGEIGGVPIAASPFVKRQTERAEEDGCDGEEY
jgi:hypothetical protein